MNKKNRKKFLKKIDEKAKIKKLALETVQQMQSTLSNQPAYTPSSPADIAAAAKASANNIFNKVLEEAIEELLNEVDAGNININ